MPKSTETSPEKNSDHSEWKHQFAVFILSHGRADRIFTISTLRRQGYTGPIFIIIDDLDTTRDEYLTRYGDDVIIFDKVAVSKTFDAGDNFESMRSTSYPRNVMFQIAKERGVRYFLQLDDDYTNFRIKFDHHYDYSTWGPSVKSLDRLFSYFVEYMQNAPITTLCFAQGGDFIGGKGCFLALKIRTKRKAMNTFFCDTLRPYQFIGKLNEDVNTYLIAAKTGRIMLTTSHIAVEQKATQSNAGGMTEAYKQAGTYVKSFYSVMYHPSAVRVYPLGNRLHHRISWMNAGPMILSESIKRCEEKEAISHASQDGNVDIYDLNKAP
jgi:hypothetical protein